jgi:hypothetical protein
MDSVSQKEYEKLLLILRNNAKTFGTQIRVYKRRKSQRSVMYRYDKKKKRSSVTGLYSEQNNRIGIYIYGKQSRIQILGTLAHEVRHAEHVFRGLFKEYYNFKRFYTKKNLKLLSTNPFKVRLPNLRTGLLAEEDCCRFARKWLNKQGIETFTRESAFLYIPYPIENVKGYNYHTFILQRREEFKKSKR